MDFFILLCSCLLYEAQKVVLGVSVNVAMLLSGLHSEYGLFYNVLGGYRTRMIFLL